jgi:GNAT superfamily N-acetyltransferase
MEEAAALVVAAHGRAAEARGQERPWSSAQEVIGLLARSCEAAPDTVVVADAGGAIAGVGALRVRGEVATVGPLAVAADGRGTGSAVIDHLLELADQAGCSAVRALIPGWHPAAYALCTGRGFHGVDLVARIERRAAQPPPPGTARGLEIATAEALRPAEMDELARFDHKLTGLDRRGDLVPALRLVARRHGGIVGYLGWVRQGNLVVLGPAVAVDSSDLFLLVARALTELSADRTLAGDMAVRARLSTAPQLAPLSAVALGFQVRELGVLLSRGTPPPTRPPQLYSCDPEVY